METPGYFVDLSTLWHEWDYTEIRNPNHEIIVGSAVSGSAVYAKAEVEALYPGFVSAYQALTNVGCDRYFVTPVLKFCILQANNFDLLKPPLQSATLKMVEAALALGLSGEDFAQQLISQGHTPEASELPNEWGVL